MTSAMKEGHIIILDEIALVMDSVLERMNSIFETDSVLVLSEKNINDNVEIIHPHKNFCIIGTICPSALEGKKELSQALRARFTEIYIPKTNNDDTYTIIEHKVMEIGYFDLASMPRAVSSFSFFLGFLSYFGNSCLINSVAFWIPSSL